MIYTAVAGDRDAVREDVRCMTTNKWFANPRMAAKCYKVLPHLWFNENSVWIDANITAKLTEREMMDKMLKDADIALFRHPFRKTVAEEVEEVCKLGLDKLEHITAFKDYYGDKLLASLPLYECNVIIRRNSELVSMFNERWWALICRWSQRDQLTFPIALANSELKVAMIEPMDVRKHPDFIYRKHAN